MNTSREDVDETDSKFADDELDVYNLIEDQLWTNSELEEMRTRKTFQTKKSSSASVETETVEDKPETAPEKKAPRVKTSGVTSGEESRPDFYHGVGPYNDVNLPGVWFFRIPHKVIKEKIADTCSDYVAGGFRWCTITKQRVIILSSNEKTANFTG